MNRPRVARCLIDTGGQFAVAVIRWVAGCVNRPRVARYLIDTGGQFAVAVIR